MSTSETSGRPPAGHVANPAAIAEARRRGWPATPQTIADAATLASVPPFVAASDTAVAAGLSELAAIDRDQSQRAHTASVMKQIETELGT